MSQPRAALLGAALLARRLSQPSLPPRPPRAPSKPPRSQPATAAATSSGGLRGDREERRKGAGGAGRGRAGAVLRPRAALPVRSVQGVLPPAGVGPEARRAAPARWPPAPGSAGGRRRGRALHPSPRRAVRLPRGPPYSMPTSEAPRERGRSGPRAPRAAAGGYQPGAPDGRATAPSLAGSQHPSGFRRCALKPCALGKASPAVASGRPSVPGAPAPGAPRGGEAGAAAPHGGLETETPTLLRCRQLADR